jgi:hypothetical protein
LARREGDHWSLSPRELTSASQVETAALSAEIIPLLAYRRYFTSSGQFSILSPKQGI